MSRFISETIHDRVTVAVEHQYKLVCNLLNGAISDDLEWLLAQIQGHTIIQS